MRTRYWLYLSLRTMTSSNGNIFRVPGPLCGEFNGERWIPHTQASDAELWCFLWSARINAWVNNREAGYLRRHRAHYDVIVMITWFYLTQTIYWAGTTRICSTYKLGRKWDASLKLRNLYYIFCLQCIILSTENIMINHITGIPIRKITVTACS